MSYRRGGEANIPRRELGRLVARLGYPQRRRKMNRVHSSQLEPFGDVAGDRAKFAVELDDDKPSPKCGQKSPYARGLSGGQTSLTGRPPDESSALDVRDPRGNHRPGAARRRAERLGAVLQDKQLH